MLPDNDVTLRREELGDALQLNPKVIHALISSGALPTMRRDGAEVVAAKEVERLLRDSLMRLYYTQATRAAVPVRQEEVEFELEPEKPVEEEIVRIAREPEPEAERPDLRLGARYIPRKQIGGLFREVKFAVLQLSNEGLRIRHSERIRPGEDARLSIAILTPSKSFVMRAQVVWTSIAQRGDEPSFYISGLRVTANVDRLAAALDALRAARELHLDESGQRRRVAAAQPPSLPDEEVVAIIRAVRRFASDPAEATRWYTRARFAVADDDVRRAAPRSAREREEVVGVWEYLQRRIDLKAVAGVVQWIRNSQAAAV
ncbi:MAG TPA: PilZ domain-containing protein [Thermoanaerobaculia bacterium]|nr:PilZ domain-containing protein [Thermoanaerobaculia bacterium]